MDEGPFLLFWLSCCLKDTRTREKSQEAEPRIRSNGLINNYYSISCPILEFPSNKRSFFMENKFLCKNKFHVELLNQLTQVNQYELVSGKCSNTHCFFFTICSHTDSKDKNQLLKKNIKQLFLILIFWYEPEKKILRKLQLLK